MFGTIQWLNSRPIDVFKDSNLIFSDIGTKLERRIGQGKSWFLWNIYTSCFQSLLQSLSECARDPLKKSQEIDKGADMY